MKHIDAYQHVRGESQYIDDVMPPQNMLQAAVLPSPVAHGKIRKLDTGLAKKIEGVVAVLTAHDIPGSNVHGTIIQDDQVLCDDEVRFVGEPVAVVVATSVEIARKAAKQIQFEIAELPAILDPRTAFAKGEIIGSPRTFVLGDVEKAWANCDLIVEGSCDSGAQEHVYLETQRARAIPMEGGLMRVYSSTQSPSAVQRTVAKMLKIPLHQVEVDVKRLGGGFGGKEDQATGWACLAALAAWYTKRPVELVLSRSEDMKMTGKRHPYTSDFKIGVTKDGKILAYEVKMYQDAGATADLSPAILDRSLFHATNAYFVPHVRAFAVSCRTNLLSNTAFRGFGGPQGMFVIEAAIAKVAEKLGMPREEIQYKNLLQEGDSFAYGQKAKNARAKITWDEAMRKYSFSQIMRRVNEYNRSHGETKKGVAVMPICFGISFTTTFLNQASALVHIYTDGSVSVSTNGVEMGQGITTNLAEIAVQALGIKPQRVKIESVNTKRTINMSASAASACTDLNGNALLHAAGQLLDRLKAHAATQLKLGDQSQVAVVDEKVVYDGQETGWDWNKLIETAYLSRVDLSAHGFYATPNIHFNRETCQGEPFAYHVFGTAIIEVTVDCLRGTYDIDSIKIVHDRGQALNDQVLLGQVEGGLAQGLGWMSIEEITYNAKGQIMAGALATYKVPDITFMPNDLEVTFLENQHNPSGPLGVKAVGEPPLMYGIGLFFALRQAIKAFAPKKELAFHAPYTPEKVLLALHG